MIRRSYLNNVADANVSILVASRENYLQKVKESNQQYVGKVTFDEPSF